MITITLGPDYIEIKGHAHEGEGTANPDEIRACAAVTTAAQQLLYSLEDINEDINSELGFGIMKLKMNKLSHDGETLKASFLMMIKLLEQTFGEYITIIRPDMEDDIKAIGN